MSAATTFSALAVICCQIMAAAALPLDSPTLIPSNPPSGMPSNLTLAPTGTNATEATMFNPTQAPSEMNTPYPAGPTAMPSLMPRITNSTAAPTMAPTSMPPMNSTSHPTSAPSSLDVPNATVVPVASVATMAPTTMPTNTTSANNTTEVTTQAPSGKPSLGGFESANFTVAIPDATSTTAPTPTPTFTAVVTNTTANVSTSFPSTEPTAMDVDEASAPTPAPSETALEFPGLSEFPTPTPTLAPTSQNGTGTDTLLPTVEVDNSNSTNTTNSTPDSVDRNDTEEGTINTTAPPTTADDLSTNATDGGVNGTEVPSTSPTISPTILPIITQSPSQAPSEETDLPTANPTELGQTEAPTATGGPTDSSASPTMSSMEPTAMAVADTMAPTTSPTAVPTLQPSAQPTDPLPLVPIEGRVDLEIRSTASLLTGPTERVFLDATQEFIGNYFLDSSAGPGLPDPPSGGSPMLVTNVVVQLVTQARQGRRMLRTTRLLQGAAAQDLGLLYVDLQVSGRSPTGDADAAGKQLGQELQYLFLSAGDTYVEYLQQYAATASGESTVDFFEPMQQVIVLPTTDGIPDNGLPTRPPVDASSNDGVNKGSGSNGGNNDDSMNTGIILGLVFAIISLILGILVVYLYCKGRRDHRASDSRSDSNDRRNKDGSRAQHQAENDSILSDLGTITNPSVAYRDRKNSNTTAQQQKSKPPRPSSSNNDGGNKVGSSGNNNTAASANANNAVPPPRRKFYLPKDMKQPNTEGSLGDLESQALHSFDGNVSLLDGNASVFGGNSYANTSWGPNGTIIGGGHGATVGGDGTVVTNMDNMSYAYSLEPGLAPSLLSGVNNDNENANDNDESNTQGTSQPSNDGTTFTYEYADNFDKSTIMSYSARPERSTGFEVTMTGSDRMEVYGASKGSSSSKKGTKTSSHYSSDDNSIPPVPTDIGGPESQILSPADSGESLSLASDMAGLDQLTTPRNAAGEPYPGANNSGRQSDGSRMKPPRPPHQQPKSTASWIKRLVPAPEGKLGIVIDTTIEGPIVHMVHPTSRLRGTLFPGDVIIGIDSVDTRAMSATDITSLMVATSNKTRRLTVLSDPKRRGKRSAGVL